MNNKETEGLSMQKEQLEEIVDIMMELFGYDTCAAILNEVKEKGVEHFVEIIKKYNEQTNGILVYTINLIDQGFLKDSYMTTDIDQVMKKSMELYELNYNEYNNEGYIAIEQGKIRTKEFSPTTRIVQINLDDERKEAEELLSGLKKIDIN